MTVVGKHWRFELKARLHSHRHRQVKQEEVDGAKKNHQNSDRRECPSEHLFALGAALGESVGSVDRRDRAKNHEGELQDLDRQVIDQSRRAS